MSNLLIDMARAFLDGFERAAGPDPVDQHAAQVRAELFTDEPVMVTPAGVDLEIDVLRSQLRQRNRAYGRASATIGCQRDIIARLQAEARLRTELSARRVALETDVPRSRVDRLEADIAKLRDDLRRSPVRAGQMRAEGVQAALDLVWKLLDEHKAPAALDYRTDQRKAPLTEKLAEKNADPADTAKVGDADVARAERGDGSCCGAIDAYYICTRARGHLGQHIAGNGLKVARVWPQEAPAAPVTGSVIGQTITGREARDLPRNSVLMVDSQDVAHPGPVVRVDGGWWAPDSPRPEPLDGAARFRVIHVPGREVRPRDRQAAIETAARVLEAHDWNSADDRCECGYPSITPCAPTYWQHVAERLAAVGALGSLTPKETS